MASGEQYDDRTLGVKILRRDFSAKERRRSLGSAKGGAPLKTREEFGEEEGGEKKK